MSDTAEDETAWTPDLIGPIFKNGNISLREVLNTHRDDRCTRMMATFVPDELIYESDLTKKNFRKFNAVLVLINVSRFFNICEKYMSAENGGSYSLFAFLNNYINAIVEEVYITHGDVLKFTQDSLLIMWKVNRNEFFSRTIYNVILCAQKIQASVAMVKCATPISKVDISVSAGEVIFSVIGDDSCRDFVIGGSPIDDLKFAKRICLPGDLVLCSSAWEHCAPSQYEYVIKDSRNIKIIKVLTPPEEPHGASTSSEGDIPTLLHRPTASASCAMSEISRISKLSLDSEVDTVHVQARVSVLDAFRRRIGAHLKSYMPKPVLMQIENEEPLNYLTEVRQITTVSVSVVPAKCTVHELISLVDELYKVIQNIIEKHFGCIATVNLFEKDISFYILFGVKGYCNDMDVNNSRNALLSASQIIREAKRTGGVKTLLVGVSSGMVFCGIVGHIVRRQYMIFGLPTNKAISLMTMSFDKISCDYDTLYSSLMSKEKFRSRGVRVLKVFGKCHVYEYIDAHSKLETLSNLEYSYPILGRFQDIECFKDILDDIGVSGRLYAGLLIEGAERSGKSRILDAYVSIIRNRQIRLVQLSLHASYSEKACAVLYHMFLQIFDAERCMTIDDRERVLLHKLSDILEAKDFCYLNTIMRVSFPLSDEYCEDTDWKRHKKTIEIFDLILTEVVGRVCILLDDAQYMDLLSWQFLSSALNNDNVILVMTMLEPHYWDNMSQVEAGICQEKRLMNRTLHVLDAKYLAAFACQFLNVMAIPKGLEKVLQQHSKNTIGWCEAFLMSALQVNALNFVTISPVDAVNHDLVFPESSLLSKIPVYLTPEEVAPPLHWMQMSALHVCIASGKSKCFVEPNRDVIGLRIDMYNRMNAYEQDFIKCAASLGDIFIRNMAESVMVNATPVYTSKFVEEMIRLRVLECAMIQRKHFHSDETVLFVLQNRKTFSNMHHLVICDCPSSRGLLRKTLPPYAYCKVLEFTISSYRDLLFDILSQQEKNDYNIKAANIYERNARKCNTCGSGFFLEVSSKEEFTTSNNEMLQKLSLVMQRKSTLHSWHDKSETNRSVYSVENNDGDKKRDGASIRRISILPVHTDADSDVFSDLSPESSREGQLSNGGKKLTRTAMGFDSKTDVFWDDRLKEFSYIDYRNCRCMETIDYIFWKLSNHLAHSRDIGKLLKFMMEYSAGLIETAQPLYATKYIASTTAHIEAIKGMEKLIVDTPDAIADKGRSLVLLGDAYVAYGNYPQAKKFYTEAVALRYELPQTVKAICYNAMLERMRYKVRGIPKSTINRDTGLVAIAKLELAVYLHRLSMVSMLQKDAKMAKLSILQALRAAFESSDGFLVQGKIYLTAVQIFRQLQELNMIMPLEKPMMLTLEQKINWKTPEDVIVVAEVYRTIYESRILHGNLAVAIEIGIKTCKICNCLHLNRLKLAILPSLIQIMVWTKQVNKAIDLLHELYYLSKEDIDYSGITWYYALCMELSLDAAMVIETYETCNNFYKSLGVSRSNTRVLRDPESLSRLSVCIVIWQLRMNMIITDAYVKDAKEYLENTVYNNFSQVYNCIKGLECYLLILTHRINIRKSSDLFDRIQSVTLISKFLQEVSNYVPFAKPFLHLLESYLELSRGRKTASYTEIQKSYKYATSQGNKLVLAWIEQNKRTWEEAKYNNMAQYWVEHVGTGDAVRWQEIHSFSLSAWSTILFPFPVPNMKL